MVTKDNLERVYHFNYFLYFSRALTPLHRHPLAPVTAAFLSFYFSYFYAEILTRYIVAGTEFYFPPSLRVFYSHLY